LDQKNHKTYHICIFHDSDVDFEQHKYNGSDIEMHQCHTYEQAHFQGVRNPAPLS
jgi:hypothetical protein